MKRCSILLVVFWVSVLPCRLPAAGTFADGPAVAENTSTLSLVSIEGNRFVDPEGNTVVFRGLVLSDPFALRERGQWGRPYFEEAKNWNANIVRIPVHPEAWRKAGEQEYLKMLDEGIQWAGELGMYVIIDWHSIGNPLTEVFHRPGYITSRGETFRFWYAVASRYAGNPTVALYELFNEPTNSYGRMGPMPWAEYKSYIEDIISMIRHCDDTALPLVAGFDFAYNLSSVREDPIDFERVAYAVHPYPQKRRPPWESQWQQDWGFAAEKYPLVATEFGFMSADDPGAHSPTIADEAYGEAIVAFFEERGISWLPWVFDPHWVPSLFSDWEYTPTRQGSFFRRKLVELNE